MSDIKGQNSSQTLSLGGQLIRLAFEHPEFRKNMRPVLRAVVAARKPTIVNRDKDREEFFKLLTFGPRFGIVSADKKGAKKEENQIRRTKLISDLKHLGYRKVSPLQEKWGLLPKNSLLIKNIRPEDLFELGRKHEQDFVVFSNESNILGFYYTKGDPKTKIIVNPQGDPLFLDLMDITPHSKSKGLDADKDLLWSQTIPWDGSSVLNRKLMKNLLKTRTLNVPEEEHQ